VSLLRKHGLHAKEDSALYQRRNKPASKRLERIAEKPRETKLVFTSLAHHLTKS